MKDLFVRENHALLYTSVTMKEGEKSLNFLLGGKKMTKKYIQKLIEKYEPSKSSFADFDNKF